VIGRSDMRATLPATGKRAHLDVALASSETVTRPVRRRPPDCPDHLAKIASVLEEIFFLGRTLGHLFGRVSEALAHLQACHGGQRVLGVPFLGDELAADLGGATG